MLKIFLKQLKPRISKKLNHLSKYNNKIDSNISKCLSIVLFNTKIYNSNKNLTHFNININKRLFHSFSLSQRDHLTYKNLKDTTRLNRFFLDKAKVNYINMTQPTINYFAHSFLDRCSDKRRDSKFINEQIKSDKTVFVLFHVDRPFVSVANDKNMYSLYKFNYSQVKQFIDEPSKCAHVFLGLEYVRNEPAENTNNFETCHSPYSDEALYDKKEFRSWFAIDTSSFDENPENVTKLLGFNEAQFFEGNFLRLMAIQDSLQSSIIAQARSVFCWIDRNKYCATCGHINKLEDAGNKLACENEACKSKNKLLNKMVPSNIHYPRVDPVVIMLIINQAKTHVLLGRKKQFPKNMFSCLAGFVECGESIEEAVRREVFEESGIYTTKIIYNSSQPWPFPSTLMIGCFAYASSDEINIDQDEIEDAKWFSLDEIDLILKNEHPDKITIPTERAIAHQLISYFNKNKAKL